MINKLLYSCLFLSIIGTVDYLFFSVSGERWFPEPDTKYLAMYYNTINCHDCVDELWQYISQACQRDSTLRPLIIIPKSTMLHMRQDANYLHEKFGDTIPIVYENPSDKKKSLIHRKKIKEFPCLLTIGKKGKIEYYSYHQLFSGQRRLQYIHP